MQLNPSLPPSRHPIKPVGRGHLSTVVQPLQLILLVLAVLLPPALAAKSAPEVADAFVVPPAFKFLDERKEHGRALISECVTRRWVDPHGVILLLLFDDGNSIASYHLSAQFSHAVQQLKDRYPNEVFDLTDLFTVNKKDWIVVRSRGTEKARPYLRVIILGELDNLYAQIQLVGPVGQATAMGLYLKSVVQSNSPRR